MKEKNTANKMIKKIKKSLIIFCALIFANGIEVRANNNECVDEQGIEYVLNMDGTCYISDCSNDNITSIKIPDKITFDGKEYIVTKIKGGFSCENVTSISIPHTITSISFVNSFGFYQFYCPQLAKITVDLGNPNYFSDENGWLYNKDKTILYHIPYTVTEIVIPNGVKKLQCELSCNHNLIKVEMPNSVEVIEKPDGMVSGTFTSCSKLSRVVFSDNLTKIPRDTFAGCSALTEIILPSKLQYIGAGAFGGCENIKSIYIPDSVTKIESGAFEGCGGLINITLPSADYEYISNYGAGVLENCSSLKTVTMKTGTTKISRYMFRGCEKLESITIPETVKEIEIGAFWKCIKLKSVTIPKSVTLIDNLAFPEKITIYGYRGSAAEKIVQHNSVYANYDQKFVALDSTEGEKQPSEQATTSDNIEQSLPAVGAEAKLSTGIYKVTKSSATTKEAAFLKLVSTKKTSITIPATVVIDGQSYMVTEISSKAFKSNSKLKSVIVGKNVKKIGTQAFYNCKKLSKITIKSTSLKSVGKNAIKNIDKTATIKVPKQQLSKYKKLFSSKTGYKKTMKIKK